MPRRPPFRSSRSFRWRFSSSIRSAIVPTTSETTIVPAIATAPRDSTVASGLPASIPAIRQTANTSSERLADNARHGMATIKAEWSGEARVVATGPFHVLIGFGHRLRTS